MLKTHASATAEVCLTACTKIIHELRSVHLNAAVSSGVALDVRLRPKQLTGRFRNAVLGALGFDKPVLARRQGAPDHPLRVRGTESVRHPFERFPFDRERHPGLTTSSCDAA